MELKAVSKHLLKKQEHTSQTPKGSNSQAPPTFSLFSQSNLFNSSFLEPTVKPSSF